MQGILHALPIMGSVITMVLGGIGLVRPEFFLRICGLQPRTNMGTLEIRAVFGGCLITLGVVCLVSGAPFAYLLAGLLWLTSGGVKLTLMRVDKVSLRSMLLGLAGDIPLGVFMLSGYWVLR